jgi:hypothetical protein
LLPNFHVWQLHGEDREMKIIKLILVILAALSTLFLAWLLISIGMPKCSILLFCIANYLGILWLARVISVLV